MNESASQSQFLCGWFESNVALWKGTKGMRAWRIWEALSGSSLVEAKAVVHLTRMVSRVLCLETLSLDIAEILSDRERDERHMKEQDNRGQRELGWHWKRRLWYGSRSHPRLMLACVEQVICD